MVARDLRREVELRRILEGVIATVTGGLILWSVTSSMSQPAPVVQATAAAIAPAAEAEAAPEVPKLPGRLRLRHANGVRGRWPRE